MFTQVIIRKLPSGNETRTDGCTTDGHTDDQRETIISRHYCVAGYKKFTCGTYCDLSQYMRLHSLAVLLSTKSR